MSFQRWKPVLLVPLAALLAACGGRPGDEGDEEAAGRPGPADSARPRDVMFTAAQVQHGGVHWEAAVLSGTARTAVVPGTIVPDEDRTARLGAPARGRVIAVTVRPGDRVAQGQVLVTLHSPEAAMAQSDAEKAQAELTSRRAQAAYAKSARDRAERLLALKAIPRQDYERAVADDELARAAQAQAEAELRRASSTAEQLAAGTISGEIALRAPTGGVVLSRTALPGAVVEAGSPLVTVTDPSRLWLTVDVPEQYAHWLRAGSSLEFTVPAYAVESFSARIDAVAAGLDPQTRTLPVRGTISNRNGRLRPEMLASVTLQAAESTPAVLLPADAVQTVAGKTIVFIAMPNAEGGAHLMSRDVEVGTRTGARIAVTRGIQAGELVVTRGAFAVKSQLEKAAMPKMEM